MEAAVAEVRVEAEKRAWIVWAAAFGAGLWLLLLNQLHVEWSINSQYSYGWGVPLLMVYLFWKRWEDRPAAGGEASGMGLKLLVGGLALSLLPLRLIQEANPDWRLVSWMATLVVVGLTLAGIWRVGGAAWLRHFWFPVCFIFLAVPWPSSFEQGLIQSLMRAVASVTVEAVNWLGEPAVRQGNLIETQVGLIGVNEACSGVRSLQGTLMAALFLGELARLRWLRRLVLLGVGLAAALVFNVVRTLWLTLAAVKSGTASLEEWHDPAGYVVLAGSFGVLLWVVWLLSRGGSGEGDRERSVEGTVAERIVRRPVSIWWVVLLAGWLLVIETWTEGWYRVHEQGPRRELVWGVEWPEGQGEIRPMAISEDTRTILRYSEGKSGLWMRDDGTQWLIYFFRWVPGRAAAQLAKNHTPEICLPASGLRLVEQSGSREVRVGKNLELAYTAYVFESRGKPLYVFFCLWEQHPDGTAGSGPDFSRAARFRAVLEGRRHLGQQVLEVAISGSESLEHAEQQFRESLGRLVTVQESEEAADYQESRLARNEELIFN